MKGLAAALFLLSACTTVNIHSPDGTITVTRGFGMVRIEAAPGTGPVTIDTKGVGIFSFFGGFYAGWTSARFTILPFDDCRIMIFNNASPEAWAEVFGKIDAANICFEEPFK